MGVNTSEPSGAIKTGMRVLGVGVATLDIINRVANYPTEDSEVRALAQRRNCGGNVINTLTVLQQCGHGTDWMGTYADDHGAADIVQTLATRGIGYANAVAHRGTMTPTSFITLSQASGSRTIVHYRTLPELTADEFAQLPLAHYDWIHFEGRHPEQTARMVARVQRERPQLPISIEIEKNRPGIAALLLPVRLLIFARTFITATSTHDPRQFLLRQQALSKAQICAAAWGESGAYAVAMNQTPLFAPAYRPPVIVETLAAGDVFNAAFIDAQLRQLPLAQALNYAVHLAGHRCGREGLDGLVASAIQAGIDCAVPAGQMS